MTIDCTWRSCGIRSICILGGALSGAVTGACAATMLIKQLLMNDSNSPCGSGLPGSCLAFPMAMIFTGPLLILGSSATMIPIGAIAGNRIANQILNQKKQD